MHRRYRERINTVVRFLGCLFWVSIVASCSVYLDPFDVASQKDEQETLSLKHANYRLQKKYDLLEESLHKEYEKHLSQNHLFGQLYTILDLADFFIYGFIDYDKSLEYYDKAMEINAIIRGNGYIGDNETGTIKHVEKEEPIVYYKAENWYAIPRKYDFQEIANHIKVNRDRIQRILGERSLEAVPIPHAVFPEIQIVITNDYASAIQVGKDIFDPSIFDEFEQKLLKTSSEHFKRRYKLSEEERTYYIHYNVAKGLINTFDFVSLSILQTERILQHIMQAAANYPHQELNEERSYLQFGRILCLNRLGNHKEAIQDFNEFQKEVTIIQETRATYLKYLKTCQSQSIIVGGIKVVDSLALHILASALDDQTTRIESQRARKGASMALDAAFHNFVDAASFLPREIKFVGESDYAKNLNMILNQDEQLQLFRAVGASYHHLGNIEKSIFYNKEAINVISNLRSTIASERNRISFARYKDSVYNTLIDDLIAKDNIQEAFFYAECSRSRALVDLLGTRKDIIFKDHKTNDYIREQKKVQIYRDAMRKETDISDNQVQYMNDLCSAFVTKTGATKELLSLITVSNLQVFEIQKLLPKNASLVEYYLSDHHVYAWVLDKKNVTSYRLDIPPDQLREHVQDMHQLILKTRSQRGRVQLGDKTRKRFDLEQMYETVQELYKELFVPLETAIHSNQVYIICHRALHFLPFEVLHDGQHFLVEKYALTYLPSASLLQFLKPTDGKFPNALALGNPDIEYRDDLLSLKWAEQEAELITEIFPEKKIYTKHQATETVFREEAPHHQVLHVASHGEFESADPLSSKLFLTQDTHHDGMLTAKDLYGMQLNASLVTLSACETGMSEVETGDELLGFIRGFFFAGTSNLVASLWKVGDIATKELMVRFYTYLTSEDTSLAQALQQAKIEMIHQEEYAHPFYWAPFNLYGIGL